MSVKRNKRIVEHRLRGWSFKTIAMTEGLAHGTVMFIFRNERPAPGDGPVPDEMSVHTARDIFGVIGIWPSTETATEISARMMDIMYGCRKRNTMKELADWLRALGLQA